MIASLDHHGSRQQARSRTIAQGHKLANLAMDKRADVTDVNGAGGSAAPAAAGRGASSIGRGDSASAAPSPLDAPTPVAPKAGDRFACVRCGCVIRIEKPTGVRPHQLKPFACQCGTRMLPAPGE